MRNILLLLPVINLCGCAAMISTTEREPVYSLYANQPGGTNQVVAFREVTHLKIMTLFDAQAQVAKTGNRSGYTTNGVWGPGTYASGVNEASSSSNLVDIISAVAQGVVSGMKK